MMPLKNPISNLLSQLSDVIDRLTREQFKLPIITLSGSTIGQHIRHILEFYIELHKGYASGLVDYEQRERDHAIETDKQVALFHLKKIAKDLEKPDRELLLNFMPADCCSLSINTNYYRELAYNLEHTVHHMALIRIGVNAISATELPIGFGVAASTLKFKQTCAQ